MSSIERNIQIDLIMDNYNPIIEFFNSIWNTLDVIDLSVYNNDNDETIYYNKYGEWVFYSDHKDRFWCNFDRYYKLFGIRFNLDYEDIIKSTNVMLNNSLNRIINGYLDVAYDRPAIEQALYKYIIA